MVTDTYWSVALWRHSRNKCCIVLRPKQTKHFLLIQLHICSNELAKNKLTCTVMLSQEIKHVSLSLALLCIENISTKQKIRGRSHSERFDEELQATDGPPPTPVQSHATCSFSCEFFDERQVKYLVSSITFSVLILFFSSFAQMDQG